ncbi:sensor domain-containing diguanylate cyclase [Ramlibacter albus]|uniref:diguanylate cyclase n=1 Tax=Ramlibacter albus TaxID=2079448 RepID=A0A923S576_9BURK|nr:sensor domain-containing diguanylate cyclase [Ramlibacter albus]MBC5767663.1 sensor domain-containing diguanylate cyclase [Ramlibacter albus]
MHATDLLSRWRAALPALVLVAGIALSFGIARLFEQESVEEARAVFEARSAMNVAQVEDRLRAYQDLLHAMRGFFDASRAPGRDEYRAFTGALEAGSRYPELSALEYAEHVTAAAHDAFALRTAASPIHPPGERRDYLVATLAEQVPAGEDRLGLDWRSVAQLGGAAERARSSGTVAGTTRFSTPETAAQPGRDASATLMLAVYEGGGVPADARGRWLQLRGVAAVHLRIEALVAAALGAEALQKVRVRIVERGAGDPLSQGARRVLFDSMPGMPPEKVRLNSIYTTTHFIALGDEHWACDLMPLDDPMDAFDVVKQAAILAAMLVASCLAAWLVHAHGTLRRSREQLLQANTTSTRLLALGEGLQACGSLGDAFDVLASEIPMLLPATSGAVLLREGGEYVEHASWGLPATTAVFGTAHCQALRRGHLYANEGTAVRCAHLGGGQVEFARYACVPLVAQGEPVGLMHVQLETLDPLASPTLAETSALAAAVAQEVALTLANLRLRGQLESQAMHDQLTGLYNRHYMESWLEQETRRTLRSGKPLAALMIDIDHFKRINDTWGHEAGDRVLREVALALKDLARGSDVVCRYGGEEFLVLLPEAALEPALRRAEQLREAVARLAIELGARGAERVTVSVGVAAFPGQAASAEALVAAADAALYDAKAGGRNRVCAAAPIRPAAEAAPA